MSRTQPSLDRVEIFSTQIFSEIELFGIFNYITLYYFILQIKHAKICKKGKMTEKFILFVLLYYNSKKQLQTNDNLYFNFVLLIKN